MLNSDESDAGFLSDMPSNPQTVLLPAPFMPGRMCCADAGAAGIMQACQNVATFRLLSGNVAVQRSINAVPMKGLHQASNLAIDTLQQIVA